MKKVILNGTITDLDGNVQQMQSGRIAIGANGLPVADAMGNPIREVKNQTFGRFVLDALLQSPTKDDAETQAKFALCERINENLKLAAPTELELSDTEFETVSQTMSRQRLLIKARWLEMVEGLNA